MKNYNRSNPLGRSATNAGTGLHNICHTADKAVVAPL